MQKKLQRIHQTIKACRECPNMCDTPVHGRANLTRIMLIGQAPGKYEGPRGRPFAHTSGTTLFKWLGGALNLTEDELREEIYFAAVTRCYPGPNKTASGDRVPTQLEIINCRRFLAAEARVLKPTLVLAVGALAISEVLQLKTVKLNDVVGKTFKTTFHGQMVSVIPLPHPSGRNTWVHSPLGKRLLPRALAHVAELAGGLSSQRGVEDVS